jgi:hypothetical protein
MKQLPVGKSGKHGFTLVDDEDADIASGRTISKNTSGYCYIANYYGYHKHALLHRLLMERMVGRPLLSTEIIDHFSGQKLDNRRSNLNITDSSGNNFNRECHRNGHLAGTTYDKKRDKWRAQIKVDGKQKTLGYFLTQAAAHQAYLEAVANP